MYRGNIDAAYGSHIPILAAAVAKVPGPVLELGAGDSSTPMLHYMCKVLGKPLVTFETDKACLERFLPYRGPTHVLGHADHWFSTGTIPIWSTQWGVVLVDCAPGGDRWRIIERLVGNAALILAHDSEKDHGSGADYKYERVVPLFKHVTEFKRFRPYTLALSNTEPFEIEETDKVWFPHDEVAK